MLYLRITYVNILLCKNILPKIYLHSCLLVVTFSVLGCLLDDGGLSQQVIHENPITFFSLNTHCEIHPQQVMEYWKVIKIMTNTFRGHKNRKKGLS